MIEAERWTDNRVPSMPNLDAINRLRKQLEPKAHTWTLKDLKEFRDDPDVELIIVTDGPLTERKIIGIATLYIHRSITHGVIGEVRNVIIEEGRNREDIEDALDDVLNEVAGARGAREIIRMNDSGWEQADQFFEKKKYTSSTMRCYRREVF